MDHRDVFFMLRPQLGNQKANRAYELPENGRWRTDLNRTEDAEDTQYHPQPKESTPTYESDDPEELASCLVVRFSQLDYSALGLGFRMGSDPGPCGIRLGHFQKGVSKNHYRLVVDDQLRVFFHDSGSRRGSAIVYDKNDNTVQVRSNARWLLTSQPGTDFISQRIILSVCDAQFDLVFPNHARGSRTYRRQLQNVFDHQEKGALSHHEVRMLDGDNTGNHTNCASGLMTPTAKDTYHKIEHLGSGNYGNVYKAMRGRDGAFFALEVVKPFFHNSKSTAEIRKEWKDEYETTFKGRHPNVVNILDFLENPELAMVMDYYPASSLDKKPLSKAGYISAMGQILDGLDYLHSCKIVHRDLKPENFLRARPFKVVIADFGLSKVMSDSESYMSSRKGSPCYMSPAFYQRKVHYGAEVDIYSLGVILIQWFYKLPATSDRQRLLYSENQLMDWKMSWHVSILERLGCQPKTPKSLVELIWRMVHYEPPFMSAADCLAKVFADGHVVRHASDNLCMCKDWETRQHPFPQGLEEPDDTDDLAPQA